MPDNRDLKICAAVPCPKCGAKIGQYCVTNTTHVTSHTERRAAWQRVRGPIAPLTPKVRCQCGHRANDHGSELNNEFGCGQCQCVKTREHVRAVFGVVR